MLFCNIAIECKEDVDKVTQVRIRDVLNKASKEVELLIDECREFKKENFGEGN